MLYLQHSLFALRLSLYVHFVNIHFLNRYGQLEYLFLGNALLVMFDDFVHSVDVRWDAYFISEVKLEIVVSANGDR